MNGLAIAAEIFFSIHVLLLFSSLMRERWLRRAPSFKLKCVRFLLISCVLSPIVVHCIGPAEKPLILKVVSLDAVQEYVSQPMAKPQPPDLASHVVSNFKISALTYWQLLLICLVALILWQSFRLVRDLSKLNAMLRSAIPYRSCGRLVIKVSTLCHIPFSLRLLNKAYIVLPVSLLSSANHVKIAIAHEGQHHRHWDCLWAYFIEAIRIVFFGNPGVTRWRKIHSELQELSCDEALVGHQKISAHDYGHCLFHVVQTVSQFSQHAQREFACTVGMAWGDEREESTFIIRRINMLPHYTVNSSKRLLGIAFASIAITLPMCTAYAAMGSLSSMKMKEIDTSFIEPKIQAIAATEIAAAVKKYHAKSGAIVVVDPNTGKVVAFAEAGTINSKNSWKSRVFAPASTIKPFIAAAAIDSGVVSASTKYDCHSPYYVDGVKFTNSDPNVGSVSVADAIVQSVNVCLVKVAKDTGLTVVREKLSGFGFNVSSWPEKNKSDDLQLATASLGENIPVTLDSLAETYAVLANKGHSPQKNVAPVVSELTASTVTHMLERAVTLGTGKQAAMNGIAVAGKTGTLVDETNGTHLALFGGYVPANTPRFAMVVVVEDGYSVQKGEKSSSGGVLSAPVFHNVALKALE